MIQFELLTSLRVKDFSSCHFSLEIGTDTSFKLALASEVKGDSIQIALWVMYHCEDSFSLLRKLVMLGLGLPCTEE